MKSCCGTSSRCRFSVIFPPAGTLQEDISGTGDSKTLDDDIVERAGSGNLQISPIKGGFRLNRRHRATRVPRFITVWAAYEVRSGNPFKKYSPLDFRIDKPPIRIRLEGARMLLCKENIIQIEVQRGDFRPAVTVGTLGTFYNPYVNAFCKFIYNK